MSLKSNQRHELAGLLSALVDGYLEEPGRRRLEEILRTEPEALRYYVEFLDLHLQVSDPAQVATLAHPSARRQDRGPA